MTRLGGLFLKGQVHAFMASVLLGWPGLILSMLIPRRSHQIDKRLRPKRALGEAKGMPLSAELHQATRSP